MAEKQYFLDTDGLAYYHEQISDKFVTKTKVAEDLKNLEDQIQENNQAINSSINAVNDKIQNLEESIEFQN